MVQSKGFITTTKWRRYQTLIEKLQPTLDDTGIIRKKINELIDDQTINNEVILKHSQQLNRIEKELKEIRLLLSQRVYQWVAQAAKEFVIGIRESSTTD